MNSLKRREVKKVFLCAVYLPKRICGHEVRLERVEALYDGTKKFDFVLDQSNYAQSGSRMWHEFCNFCADCGLTAFDGEVWYSEHTDEDYCGEVALCRDCSYSNCYVFTDDLDHLSAWSTKYMRWEYTDKCVHLAEQLSFEAFKDKCGYNSAGGAAAMRELYYAFRRYIDKDSFTADELQTMANYARKKSFEPFGKIEWAMARLLAFDSTLFSSCAQALSDSCGDDEIEQNYLFDFFQTIYYDLCDTYVNADGSEIDKNYRMSRNYGALMVERGGPRFAEWYDVMYDKLSIH